MKDQIPQFLQDKINLKILPMSNNFPEEIKNFMEEYSKFYGWHIKKINLIFQMMRRGISELEQCEYPGCKNKKKVLWDTSIRRGCSQNHNTKLTNIDKFGVESHTQLEKNKNYGNDNIFSTKEFQEKRKESCLEKYGVEHPLQSKEIQEKVKKTNLEKYGCEWNFVSSTSLVKQKKTNLVRYGVENYAKSKEFHERYDEIRNKILITNLERYGKNHHMHSSHIIHKSVVNKTPFKRKEYIWKTGEISLVQGYEPIVLKELEEQGYKFEDVLTSPKDMPKIMYQFEDREHRYYPDFFIPKDNIIIEVKSDYTLKANWDKNQAKFESTKSLGFDFRLEVR